MSEKWIRRGVGVSNADTQAFRAFIANRQLVAQEKQKVETHEEKVSSLEGQLSRIELMLEEVLKNVQK